MTAAEFRAALKALGVRQVWLASQLDCTPQTVNKWARGVLPVPSYIPFVLRLLAERKELSDRFRL